MPKVHLDATFVLTATCPDGKDKIDFYDDTIPNFILECAANGRKTYAVRYRDKFGKQRQYKILTGCRKRELLDATWDEFQLDRQIWRIPTHRAKTNKVRHVQLSDAAIEVLNTLPRWEDCSYVIPNPDTLKPYISVFTTWDKARKAAGLPDVRMHDLRHSHASWLVEAGYSLYVVSKALGHSSSRSTERYAHVSDTTLRGASNAAAQMIGSGIGNGGKEVQATG